MTFEEEFEAAPIEAHLHYRSRRQQDQELRLRSGPLIEGAYKVVAQSR